MPPLQIETAISTNQFRFLAQLRLQEAIALLKARHWTGAMYLAGYVAECTLKAIVAKNHKNRLPAEFATHNLQLLQQEVSRYIQDEDVVIVQSLPGWSHLLRYTCVPVSAATAARFIERVEEVRRCLYSYL
jgi:hypothetical protein